MKFFFPIAWIIIFLAGCNNQTSSNTISTDSMNSQALQDDTIQHRPGGCYQMIFNSDSASLTIELKDTAVNGKLNYFLFEKDANLGTINGIWKDSMIHSFYTFRSEGNISVRETIWKIWRNELWPAFGDITERRDTVFFADPTHLQFDSVHPFVKIPCVQ